MRKISFPMDKSNANKGRGGVRPGAGRPKGEEESKIYTFKASGIVSQHLDAQKNKSEFIKDCIIRSIIDNADAELRLLERFYTLGKIYPASKVKNFSLPYFDIGIVAGFPIPLDNDERAQDIDLLRMLCPYPESCYLIRVEGDSMIEADIHSGDIVIVDKSKRNPSPNEVAVCELNGEYTLKRFEKRGDKGWLIPANPDYPELEVTEDDDFSIWGTVTFIIHRPK